MKTLTRFCDTLNLATREQNRLYNHYDCVKLVASPLLSESGNYTWEVGGEIPNRKVTTKLRNGVEVLAREVEGKLWPFTFSNRTQAASRVLKLGGDPWYVYKGYGRPFYVARKEN